MSYNRFIISQANKLNMDTFKDGQYIIKILYVSPEMDAFKKKDGKESYRFAWQIADNTKERQDNAGKVHKSNLFIGFFSRELDSEIVALAEECDILVNGSIVWSKLVGHNFKVDIKKSVYNDINYLQLSFLRDWKKVDAAELSVPSAIDWDKD